MHLILVIPCYNEECRLDTASFGSYKLDGHRHKFIFVNDGSKDNTLQVLQNLKNTHPATVEIIQLPHNRGKAEAVRTGLLAALRQNPDFIGFWDADLATPLSEIQHFCEIISDFPQIDILFGARVKLLGREIQRHRLRHYLGRIFATVVSTILRMPVYDTQCGAKLFRVTPLTKEILQEPFHARWIFDVEMLARYENAYRSAGTNTTQKIYEVPLMTWKDIKGSKLKGTDFITAIFSLGWIYFHYFLIKPKKMKSDCAPARDASEH